MNQELIDDLKQFIAATVSQATANMATKDDISNMATKDDIARLERKVDDGFAGIGEAIEQIHDQNAETDRRLTQLEQRAA